MPWSGITERAAQRIVADLVEAGYVETGRATAAATTTRCGADRPLRHPVEQPHSVGEVLAVLADLGTLFSTDPEDPSGAVEAVAVAGAVVALEVLQRVLGPLQRREITAREGARRDPRIEVPRVATRNALAQW